MPFGTIVRLVSANLLLSVSLAVSAQANGPVADAGQIRRSAFAALDAQDFAALDRQEAQLRTSHAMQSNGVWGLRTFYSGILYRSGRADLTSVAALEAFLQQWRKASPRALAPPVLLGSVYSQHAFLLRGGAYAAETSESQWAGYRQYQALAKAAFAVDPQAQKSNPAWYAARLSTATTDVLEPAAFAALLRESLVLAPDYNEPLRAVVHYAAPQWGGSADLLEQMGQVVLSTAGPQAYAVMYTEAYRKDACECNYRAEQLKIQWPTFEDGARQRLQIIHVPYLVNTYAAIACNSGHDEFLQSLKPMLMEKGKIPEIWRSFEQQPRCMRWIDELPARAAQT